MLFNSYIFILLFLPLALLGYYGINKTGKYQLGHLWLIGMSFWFYGSFGIEALLLLVFGICVNQILVVLMEKTEKELLRKCLFGAGIVFQIGLLFYYKYYNFFIENVNQALGKQIALLEIVMPIGISFYTFRQISYVVDCYQKKTKPYPFVEYMTNAVFFPLLVQGPIARHDEVVAQLQDESRKKISYESLSQGVYAFARGLAKKVLVADTFAVIADMGFGNLDAYDSVNLILVMLCYTFQIYFDFSGYSDMAYGIGKMFQIELPINFNSPYKANSVSDFWDRWHMSLTQFFTKYIYIPLGGSRKGKLRTYLNIMIVFVVSGFWHGANWTFVLWGALNGAFMVVERFAGKVIKKIPNIIRIGVTFCVTNVLWSIFRVPSLRNLKELVEMLSLRTFGGISTDFTEYFNELTEVRLLGRLGLQGMIDVYPALPLLLFVVLAFVLVWGCRNTKEGVEAFCFENGKAYGWKMAGSVILITWSVLSLSEISQFVYFDF